MKNGLKEDVVAAKMKRQRELIQLKNDENKNNTIKIKPKAAVGCNLKGKWWIKMICVADA